MALTPAQKFRQAKLARHEAQKAQAEGSDPYGTALGSEYELMLARLAEHRRCLSTIKGNDQKAVYKREAIEDFEGWVDGVLASGTGQPDAVFMEMFAWNMDAGNYPRALAMADYALKHNLPMPDQFKRAVPEFLMDEFSNAYHQGKLANDKSGMQAPDVLAQVIGMTSPLDTHDEPRAKLFKAHAYALVGCKPDSASFDPEKLDTQKGETALAELRRALELNEKAGVIKDIEKLERALKKTPPE